MFPYHDENQTIRTPFVTGVLIAACVLTWVLVQGAGAEMPLAAFGLQPRADPRRADRTLRAGHGVSDGRRRSCASPIPGRRRRNVMTSMFLHGSWMHLLGNMWFLWLFGNNIEDSMTRPRFLAFYLLCGLAAALAQVAADPRPRSRWWAPRARSAA